MLHIWYLLNNSFTLRHLCAQGRGNCDKAVFFRPIMHWHLSTFALIFTVTIALVHV